MSRKLGFPPQIRNWRSVAISSAGVRAPAGSGRRSWPSASGTATGDGPRALFYATVAWLREGKVLLPGVTRLVELVATVRQAAENRLYDTLAASVTAGQARSLEAILDVPEGLAALATGPVAPR